MNVAGNEDTHKTLRNRTGHIVLMGTENFRGVPSRGRTGTGGAVKTGNPLMRKPGYPSKFKCR